MSIAYSGSCYMKVHKKKNHQETLPSRFVCNIKREEGEQKIAKE